MTSHNPFVENKIRELIAQCKSDQNLTVEQCAAKADEIRGIADAVVPRLSNQEMFQINYAMRLFQLRHNSLDPVEDASGLHPGVKPSFRNTFVLKRPMLRRDWDFAWMLSAHIARPWWVIIDLHCFDGEKWYTCNAEFKAHLRYQFVEQVINLQIEELKETANPKHIRHVEWVAKVWHHKEDGTPTRNKRKSKRRKSR